MATGKIRKRGEDVECIVFATPKRRQWSIKIPVPLYAYLFDSCENIYDWLSQERDRIEAKDPSATPIAVNNQIRGHAMSLWLDSLPDL